MKGRAARASSNAHPIFVAFSVARCLQLRRLEVNFAGYEWKCHRIMFPVESIFGYFVVCQKDHLRLFVKQKVEI